MNTRTENPTEITYNLTDWREDMSNYMSCNWGVAKDDAESLIAVVTNACKALRGVALPYHRHFPASIDDVSPERESDSMPIKLSRLFMLIAYDSPTTINERKSSANWGRLVTKIVASLTVSIKPNGYELGVQCWENDTAIISPAVIWSSQYDRGDNDILYSPKMAMSLANLIYSEKEQGVSLMRSLVGFMVRDLMDFLTMLQLQCYELVVKKSRSRLQQLVNGGGGKFDDFKPIFDELLLRSVEQRDALWWKA